jgi:kynureninase
VPTPGAQGFQVSNPSAVDLTCLLASLSVFEKTNISALRSRSLLLTAYAEHLLEQIASRSSLKNGAAFDVITPSNPTERGAQLSVLIREDLMDGVSKALENAGIICDKRKPGCIRVAPVPMYNTFSDVWRFMETFESAIHPNAEKSRRDDSAVRLEL